MPHERARAASTDLETNPAPPAHPGKRAPTDRLPVQRRAAAPAVPAADAPGPARATPTDAAAAFAAPFFFATGPAVQARGGALSDDTVGEHAAAGVAAADAPLPYATQLQAAFGRHDLSTVRAQVGGPAATAGAAIGAVAYATGDRVGFAGPPDLHTAAHEAAHVVQQRAGVQLKGGVGAAGDRYEVHADRVADGVVRGESVEGLLDELAPTEGGHGRPAVQRRMGMELEVGRRITKADGSDLAGDTNLVDHQYFTVVSDKRTDRSVDPAQPYSNLEFVMKVFDQLAGTDVEAQQALTTRLDAIRAFYDLIYADDNAHRLDALAGVGAAADDTYRPLPKNPQQPHGATWADARIAPTHGDPAALPDGDRDGRRGELFCHFTVGYPVAKMYQAMQWLGGADPVPAQGQGQAPPPRPRLYHGRQRALDAVAVADAIGQTDWAQDLTAGQQAELKGAVTILTLQLEAFAIHLRGQARQPQVKNNTPALSRVTLHEIHASLSAPVRQAMHDNHEAIINQIADQLDGVADYNDADERAVDGLAPVTLADYAASGLGRGAEVSQQRVFGGMNELHLDQSHGMALVPVELRMFRQQYMSFDEVRAAGADLVRQSRALLLPQQQAQGGQQQAQGGQQQAQGGQQQAQGGQPLALPMPLVQPVMGPLAPAVHQVVGPAPPPAEYVHAAHNPNKRKPVAAAGANPNKRKKESPES